MEKLKLPPHNIEAEKAILGAILINDKNLLQVGDVIISTDFYQEINRIIYETMVEIYEKHQPVDLISLSNRLSEKKMLDKIGGRTYLAELTNIVATSGNVKNYAQTISQKSTRRQLIEAAGRLTELGLKEEEELSHLLDHAEQSIFQVSQKFLKQKFVPIPNILTQAFERLDKMHKNEESHQGTPTGFTDIDKLLSGLHPSDLFILAARPSVGKTSFALDIARNSAVKHNTKVGIFSLEMSKEQLVDRLLASQANVDMWRMRSGKLTDQADDDVFARIGEAMGILSEAPIFIDDSASANVMEVRTKARRLQSEHGLDMLIIDYLQLMEGSSRKSDNRTQEVAEITRGLKSIARELRIPVIALSQLSRTVESRSPAIPRLADLRESGSIEQDADIVAFIYRKKTDKSLRNIPPEEANLAEIHISKHRNGPTGIVQLYFDEQRVCFCNLEQNHQP